MATENKENIHSEKPPDAPLDRNLVEEETGQGSPEAQERTSQAQTQLSEREVFTGGEDFYKRLADSAKPSASQAVRSGDSSGQYQAVSVRHRRFSVLQKALIAAILTIAGMLTYALLRSSPEHANATATTRVANQPRLPESPVEDSVQRTQEQPLAQTFEQKSILAPSQPLSLKVADGFFMQKNYEKACAAYDQLRQRLPNTAEQEQLRDFLRLKMAVCMWESGKSDPANQLLRELSQSSSPVIRVVANYYRSLVEMDRKLYLKARARAYQTIALLGAVSYNSDWALSLERDCHFLAAESLTRNVLRLCDADKDLPKGLWGGCSLVDPFAGLNEEQLRSFLVKGSERLSKGLLSPQIQRLDHDNSTPDSQSQRVVYMLSNRWSVACQGAPLEELLARFAANAGLDISWAGPAKPISQEAKAENVAQDQVPNSAPMVSARKRPVSLYMPAVTTQQFLTVAAGHVGLLARLDERGTLNMWNPPYYSSLSEHITLLGKEALSLWQRFVLTFPHDQRIPNAHFATGLLQAQVGNPIDAIAEYKVVANRSSQTSLAPFALLHSSKLKTDLHDYLGAREDLKQLVEQYPDSELSGRATLYLADATTNARFYDEASRLYRKVYHLGYSLESQTSAALGAGKCFYEQKDYENAAKWLTLYIGLVKDYTSKDFHSACLWLGRANLALNRPKQACDALKYALAAKLSKEEYLETVSTLVKAYLQQEHFVKALKILENSRSWQFSQAEFTQILLLKANVLRAMGLVDNAIATLGDRALYTLDMQQKARISFELADCHLTNGNLEIAREILTETLAFVGPGPLADEASLKLADVCLRLGQDSQAISICTQLLDSDPSAPTKQKALELLATAYNRQKDYNRAALALLGKWDEAGVSDAKTLHDDVIRIGQ
ncbi:MAG: tetratricopeptide repeat protein [Planctomycetota bacterium]|jgi:TolA-binding protein